MIGLKEAQNIIINNINPLGTINLPLQKALNYITAQNIYAPNKFPPFNRAEKDGFVIRYADLNKVKLSVIDTLKPGEWHFTKVPEGSAVRVYEGSIIPPGGEIVIPVEDVEIQGDKILLKNKNFKRFSNIILEGSVVKVGELIIEKHTLLTPEILAFLASVGVDDVSVFKKPKATLIITGDELQNVGSELGVAKIFDSNSVFLQTAMEKYFFEVSRIIYTKDDRNELIKAIDKVKNQTNIIIITGGITKTKEDFVYKAVNTFATQEILVGVEQIPGGEMMVAKINDTIVFATSGKPFDVFVNFYEYILPILQKMKGVKNCLLPANYAFIKTPVINKTGKDLLLKGVLEGNNFVKIVDSYEFKISKDLCKKQVIVFVPAEVKKLDINDKVEIYLI